MRVAVIGVGLIGGSIAVAARRRLGAFVSGVDRNPAALDLALSRGLVDRACETAAEALEEADAAFVAVPVGALPEAVGRVLAAAPAGCVVTDVGSTKRAIVAAHGDARFVGGHPLAGTEHSGAAHADAALLDGATWYLTPTANTSPELYERLRALLGRLGARPERIAPDDHDRLVASISHLPHVLANVLVSEAAATVQAAGHPLPAAGPSFRDATRVAGAPSAVWTDIFLANGDMLAAALEAAMALLEEFKQALVASDPSRIRALNEAAADARRSLFEGAR